MLNNCYEQSRSLNPSKGRQYVGNIKFRYCAVSLYLSAGLQEAQGKSSVFLMS